MNEIETFGCETFVNNGPKNNYHKRNSLYSPIDIKKEIHLFSKGAIFSKHIHILL